MFRGRDLPNTPEGDISRFDFEAARREAPGAYGTYVVRGADVILTMGDGSEIIAAKRIENDQLEIRSTKYKRSIPEKKASAPSLPASPPATSPGATATTSGSAAPSAPAMRRGSLIPEAAEVAGL